MCLWWIVMQWMETCFSFGQLVFLLAQSLKKIV